MTLIDLLLCAFRVIYSTTKRENTFLGGTYHERNQNF
uniref:Uncharacterized protein n=1 Tax=Siphoviridae sp. ct3UN6 TaxID=2827769 RepID=A0A8S5S4X9_9CAUD|nr:MAG TPA: hypothetical protein [Siphoviridae sp. ct3UN6]